MTWADSDEDAFNLNGAVAGSIKNAEIKGYPKVLQSVLGYAAASRAVKSEQAFMSSTKYLVKNMLDSVNKKLEIEMFYGQMGYAEVSSVSTATLTITTASWAPGIWAGAEKMPVEIRDTTGATSRGVFEVSSVDMDARTVTLASSAAAAGVVATDVIWHKGAYGKEFAGVHKILSQASGTLFGINVASYNLWKGNSYSAGSAALTFNKLGLAAARAVEKGQEGKMLVLVNPRTWVNLLNEQAALRKYDASYSSRISENGSGALVFHSQNGTLEIESSIYVKEGLAFMLNEEDFMRIGSQDVSFNRPDAEGKFFRDMETLAGYELRLYTDQALLCTAPGKSVLITGIVNATS